MNIGFDIVEGKGPIIHDPIRTMEQVRNQPLSFFCCFFLHDFRFQRDISLKNVFLYYYFERDGAAMS